MNEEELNKEAARREEVDRHAVISEAVKNICDNCKECKVIAKDPRTGKLLKVISKYCKDGDGYIDVTLYDESDKFIDSCKLKHPTDSCRLPFPVQIEEQPDCGCLQNE